MDSAEKTLENPEVNDSVDDGDGNDAGEIHLGGVGEGAFVGVPERKEKVDGAEQKNLPDFMTDRSAHDSQSISEGERERGREGEEKSKKTYPMETINMTPLPIDRERVLLTMEMNERNWLRTPKSL